MNQDKMLRRANKKQGWGREDEAGRGQELPQYRAENPRPRLRQGSNTDTKGRVPESRRLWGFAKGGGQ